jgi:glycine cleavage system H lipoate-binding protein
MLCPFLSESQVRSCRVASVRKLIPHLAPATAGRCSTPLFTGCPAFREQHQDGMQAAVCPHLQESLMQYCSAAPVPQYVPWSEASVSRCGSGAFQYCDLYLDITAASSHRAMPQDTEDALPIPPALNYAANHMWLNLSADGLCHVGIDALFSRLLGRIERVDFITLPNSQGLGSSLQGAPGDSKLSPSAVVRAGGRDWQVVCRHRMNVTACNLMLRSDPSRLSSDPYGHGWMFAGTGVDPLGLMTGEQATLHMEDDSRRLNEFVQQHSGCCADGGLIEPGSLATLRREDALALFNGFLSPAAEAFHPHQGADAGKGEGR